MARARKSVIDSDEMLLTTSEAARFIRMSEKFLERDRLGERRIPFVQMSVNRVRYLRSDLLDFIAKQRRGV